VPTVVSSQIVRSTALGLAAVVAALALVAGALVSGAGPASAAATSAEQVFTAKINQARAARGLPRLATRAQLVAVARDWARTMATRSRLYHNPRLTTEVSNWRWVGENVGYGPDALTLHAAFMNSPGHRANILDRDYTEVGVGVVSVDGRVWVAQVFRRPMASSARDFRSADRPRAGFPGKLTRGDTGRAVARVQARLDVERTRRYDKATQAAVSRFQQRLGWAGRGNVGRRTWAHLF